MRFSPTQLNLVAYQNKSCGHNNPQGAIIRNNPWHWSSSGIQHFCVIQNLSYISKWLTLLPCLKHRLKMYRICVSGVLVVIFLALYIISLIILCFIYSKSMLYWLLVVTVTFTLRKLNSYAQLIYLLPFFNKSWFDTSTHDFSKIQLFACKVPIQSMLNMWFSMGPFSMIVVWFDAQRCRGKDIPYQHQLDNIWKQISETIST